MADKTARDLIYLAHTNIITLNNNFQVGYLGNTSSNTLPIGVYLGQSNYITTGANNNASGHRLHGLLATGL